MRNAKLSFRIQDINGRVTPLESNIGRVVAKFDNKNQITISAFDGWGSNYKCRENSCEVRIKKGDNSLFKGTFEELVAILETHNTQMSTF